MHGNFRLVSLDVVGKSNSQEFQWIGWTLQFLCKRGRFERRSAGQLMRRSGRVNQLTAAEVPIRPLLSVSPLPPGFAGLATRPARTS